MRMLLGLSTPWPEPIGLPAGITLVAPALLQPPGHHRIVGRVAQHLEAVGHQLFGRFERGHRVGQQRLLVAQHFELDPVGAGVLQAQQDLAAQAGHADRVVGRETAGRVRQQGVAAGVDEVEQVVALGVDQPLAAHGHRDALGAGHLQRLAHLRVVGVLAGADDQPAAKAVSADSAACPQHVNSVVHAAANLLRPG